MAENEKGGGRPQQELTAQGNANSGEQGWNKPGLSHEDLVKGFRGYIQQRQQVYQELRSPKEREYLPPSDIIRKKLDLQSGTPNVEEGEFYSRLRYAWDAIAYDHYEIGS